MNRIKFLQDSCTACISATALAGILSSCSSTRYIAGKLGEDGLFVNADEFKITKNGKTSYRSFIIIRNEALQYPVCVYRFGDADYSALWMRCTHQGAELQASGEFLQCPAHGSEFTNKGKMTNGLADSDLRTFLVTMNKNELFIDLRRV